jgi:hypothetical protein
LRISKTTTRTRPPTPVAKRTAPPNRCLSRKVDILYGKFQAGKILGEKSRRDEHIRKPKVDNEL